MNGLEERRAAVASSVQSIPGCEGIWSSGEAMEACALEWLTPIGLVEPRSDEQIASISRWATEGEISLVPWGQGSKQSHRMPEPTKALVVSTAGLDSILELDAGNLTATVQAGVTVARLQQELEAEGRILPLDPPGAENSSVGGMVATNSSGPRRFSVGTARDVVLGLKVVTPTGEIVRVGGKTVKNVAGYDLTKMFIGSWGTLGVITEITFRLLPKPVATNLILARFGQLEEATRAVSTVLRSQAQPVSLELVDGPAAKALGIDSAASETDWFLLMNVEGLNRAITLQSEVLGAILKGSGAVSVELLDVEAALTLISAYNTRPQAFADAISFKISVPIAALNDSLAAAKKAAQGTGAGLSIVSHAGNGVIYGFLKGAEPQAVISITNALSKEAVRRGGFLEVEQAPLCLAGKVPLWPPRNDYALMSTLKMAVDPLNIMNPGRKLPE